MLHVKIFVKPSWFKLFKFHKPNGTSYDFSSMFRLCLKMKHSSNLSFVSIPLIVPYILQIKTKSVLFKEKFKIT